MRLKPTRILLVSTSASKSWSATLHLPRSTFPARLQPEQQAQYLRAVTDDLYKWNRCRVPEETTGTFVLHDGPPYANGALHIGHALNKILKDVVNRFWLSQGKRIDYVPGWDCHGLPIEIKALQSRPEAADRMGPVAVRQAARNLATSAVQDQMEGFRKWAIIGSWENAYKTMDKSFVLRQLRVFKGMVEKGLIYRQYKPVYWSPSSGTALAESELEYDDNHRSTAAYIAYPIVGRQPPLEIDKKWGDVSAVIWTTTPWTLPANKAIAVHSDLVYKIIEVPDSSGRRRRLLVEESRVEHLISHLGATDVTEVIRSISGAELVGTKYRNPLFSGTIQGIIHADFVNSSSGTGLVHMAPGHGMEDHEVCSKLGIPTFAPVDAHGRFDGSALPDCLSQLSGKSVQSEGVTAVLDRLQYISTIYKSDLLLATHEIRHKYPIDWRTKQPVIVRATEQWFADVDGIKENALRAIDGVEFIPETGRSRLESFTKSRTQWCISRQRSWGVPIPALYRTDTKHHTAIIDPTTVTHIINVVQERGVDAWWTDADDDPAWIPGHLLGTYVRGKDTMDVWFDSGTTWTLLDQRNESEALADVYLEGSDQHRGWFQSSLLTHIAAQQEVVGHTGRSRPNTKAPFKTLITHGFTLDQDGRKMSKSLGNVISPDEIMNGTLLPPVQHKKQKGQKSDNNAKPSYDAMGPDALRLWVAGSDYTHDVAIGKQVLQSVNSTLQKYRITFRWLLGVLADYNHQPLRLRWSKRPFQCTLADEMALYRLEQVCQSVHQAYCNYEFLKGMKALENFVNNDLSAFYFETLKDRIYAGISSDRRAAQMILYEIFDDLLLMLAPVTPLLVEEVWAHTPAQLKSVRDDELLEGRIDKYPLHRRWDPLYTDTFERSEILSRQISEVTPVHAAVKATAEKARRAGKIGSSLECDIDIVLPATHAATRENDSDATSKGSVFSDGYVADLAGIFVVSDVQIHYDGEPDGASELAEGEWSFEVPFTVPTHGSGPLCDGRVIARKARKHKCDRCWRYVAEQEGKLCGRCDTAVKEIKEI